MPTYHKLSDQQILETLLQQVTHQDHDLSNAFTNDRNLLSLIMTTNRDHQFLKTDQTQKVWDLIREIYRRSNDESLPKLARINDPKVTQKHLIQYFHGLDVERMLVYAVDSEGFVLDTNLINIGNDATSVVSVKQIVEWALRNHARGILLAHNHPNDSLYASKPDIAMSQHIQRDLQYFNISLFDSIVVTANDTYSMAKHKEIQ